MSVKNQFNAFYVFCLLFSATVVNAVPVLQLGPSDSPDSSYNVITETWEYTDSGSGFSFNIYNLGTESLTAYLVFASVPESFIDNFNISVKDSDDISLSLFAEGFGAPPYEDPNGLAPHGIYDTWSEVYIINFDGTQVTVPDTQPGEDGEATGYMETIFVDLLGNDPLLTGIHVDLFTADYNAVDDKHIVTGFAPFSHDGELIVGDSVQISQVPVPAALWLFGTGLFGLAGIARRKT